MILNSKWFVSCGKGRTGFHLIHFSPQLEKLMQSVQQNFGTETGRQLTLTFKSCHVSSIMFNTIFPTFGKRENLLLQYL